MAEQHRKTTLIRELIETHSYVTYVNVRVTYVYVCYFYVLFVSWSIPDLIAEELSVDGVTTGGLPRQINRRRRGIVDAGDDRLAFWLCKKKTEETGSSVAARGKQVRAENRSNVYRRTISLIHILSRTRRSTDTTKGFYRPMFFSFPCPNRSAVY